MQSNVASSLAAVVALVLGAAARTREATAMKANAAQRQFGVPSGAVTSGEDATKLSLLPSPFFSRLVFQCSHGGD